MNTPNSDQQTPYCTAQNSVPSASEPCSLGSKGAALIWEEGDKLLIDSWLAKHRASATKFDKNQLDQFLALIESGGVCWTVVPSVESGVTGDHFHRLINALQGTDTELWVVDDDKCISYDLVLNLLNYRLMLEEMGCELVETDGDQRFQITLETVRAEIANIHEVIVERQQGKLACLTQTERELYEATDEQFPMGATEICERTKTIYLDSRSKGCLSNLVKFGLLRKVKGRRGYLRVPVKS
jgi:hypothetical protein